jgi:hypothetical protein
MPFEIPENLHLNLHKFAWLLGRWEGSGEGDYPTIEPFKFTWQVLFQQDGRPFMHYMAQATVVDDDGNKVRNGAQETGFLRCQEDGTVEFLLTHNTGFLEMWHGKVDGAKLDLTTDAVVLAVPHLVDAGVVGEEELDGPVLLAAEEPGLLRAVPDLVALVVDHRRLGHVVHEGTAVVLEQHLPGELERLDGRVVALAASLPPAEQPRELVEVRMQVLGDLERHLRRPGSSQLGARHSPRAPSAARLGPAG